MTCPNHLEDLTESLQSFSKIIAIIFQKQQKYIFISLLFLVKTQIYELSKTINL